MTLFVARISPVVPDAAVPTPRDKSCVATLVAAAVIVMFAVPLKLVPLMVRAVCKAVAVAALPEVDEEVVAFPLNAAVIVPAVKLPEASRATIVEAVLAFVALVASVTAVEPL